MRTKQASGSWLRPSHSGPIDASQRGFANRADAVPVSFRNKMTRRCGARMLRLSLAISSFPSLIFNNNRLQSRGGDARSSGEEKHSMHVVSVLNRDLPCIHELAASCYFQEIQQRLTHPCLAQLTPSTPYNAPGRKGRGDGKEVYNKHLASSWMEEES